MGATGIAGDLLLAGSAVIAVGGRWLVLGGETELPRRVVVAHPGVEVHWIPVDVRERNAATGPVVVHDDADELIESGAYECVLLPVPPDRDLSRRWLLVAKRSLAAGGTLVLAGANAEGIRSAIADAAALFGPARDESYRQKHRVARFAVTASPDAQPEWAGAPGIVPGTWQPFVVELGGERLELETRPGVFAGDRLDAGTALLLEHLRVEPGTRMLDIGCGVGVIGIRASRLGAASVDLVDANLLAVAAARRNLDRCGVAGRALASDVYSAVAGERYDLIVSNPPFHRGKQVDLSVADQLIDKAPGHLRPGGRILIVANAFLAYGKHLQRIFRRVETVAATRQYQVLEASEPR